MRNPERWRATKVVRDPRNGRFRANHGSIYAGSHYVADLQVAAYVPVIQQHLRGHVLDCGCGPVPFHEVYAPRVVRSTCIDRSSDPGVLELLDQVVDLNDPLPFPDGLFDSALLTDVLGHVPDPWGLLAELARVLRPGGTLVLATPLNYWLAEYPHDYYRTTRFALEDICRTLGLEILHLESYGGQADILMDSLNKAMATGNWYRLFRMLRWLIERTGWPRRDRLRTRENYALGYCLVARRPG